MKTGIGTVTPTDPSHPSYASYHRVWREGQWWADRGYDPAFGRKLPALFERCGLNNIRHESSAEVTRATSPWGRWWRETLEGIRANDEAAGSLTPERKEEYAVLTAPWDDKSFWFITALIHACWGQRLA